MFKLMERYYRFRRGLADSETSRLINLVEMHINLACTQNERIAEGNARIHSPDYSPEDRESFLKLFGDIHFFLVAADDIRKCLDRLNPRLNGQLKTVLKKYRFFFEPVRVMREHHEHIDERLPLYYGKDLMHDWTFRMCGASVNVGPPAHEVLLRLYQDVEGALGTWKSRQG